MRTTTVATLTEYLPHLAPLMVGAARTARVGKKLRLYRPEMTTLTTESPLYSSVESLARLGVTVKVYDQEHRVWSPTLVDGTVVWTARATKKERNYTCVEVVL